MSISRSNKFLTSNKIREVIRKNTMKFNSIICCQNLRLQNSCIDMKTAEDRMVGIYEDSIYSKLFVQLETANVYQRPTVNIKHI